MRQELDNFIIDSDTNIPIGTIVNYQFGLKVADEEVEDYRDNYEYIDFFEYGIDDEIL